MSEFFMGTVYEPREVEEKWYRYWEENKFFHPRVNGEQKPFCIIMPPPNVTGELHMGHALNNTLQDILIRWRRMQGRNTLWVPGTDHAGIATQARVEEELAKEGLTRHNLGREKFLERVWAWKEKYGGKITNQLRRLGASCDWERERFTMDKGCSEAVQEVFIRLYEQGLLYRGNYIVNWCPRCHTTISDIEVEHEETPGQLYYVRYPLKNGAGFITVATTRPETMLGDVAVAVHPDDERYRQMIGKTLVLPLVGREIPVIADEYVDPAFGTGAVKITPAHDLNDFEVGQRHNLAAPKVIDEEAVMTEETGKYQGLNRYAGRQRVVQDLEEQGYLQDVQDYIHAVGYCYRCRTAIEPMLSRQWFVRMRPLAEPAIKAVLDGRIRFVPERFTKIYLNWMENIRDWCISRQLWWGHRIPVWYCRDCEEMTVAKGLPPRCPQCAGQKLEQDPDVLDTWFSSALWPFSTLGWPKKTVDLAYYYPTSVLVTGRDIIFFWVARMIFSGLAFMEDVPFREVFVHGLVLDSLGRKMSKSLGNGVDPIEVIESYGADSLRFMLATGNTPGNDLRFHFEHLEGARNFTNKIWNAARFALMNLQDYQPAGRPAPNSYTLADRWIISRLQSSIEGVTASLEVYELGEAARIIYEFTWDDLCDWYIELAKPALYGKNGQQKHVTQYVLATVLKSTLELLHPFMPFLTEEIWQRLPRPGQTIIKATWPVSEPGLRDPQIEEQMGILMEITRSIRHLRSEMNVPPGLRALAILVAPGGEVRSLINRWGSYIQELARCELKIWAELIQRPEQAAHAIVKGVEIFVPLKGLINIDKEIGRLEKELANIHNDLARVQGKLRNEDFLKKARAEIVEKERSREIELLSARGALMERLVILRNVS
jgi:valyl-tRNA synthetase